MEPEQVYLDANATTPLDARVLEAMLPYLAGEFANPSSLHRGGQRARQAVEEARDQVAAAVGAARSEIVFVSGGTEGNVSAVAGAAHAERERRGLARGHIIASAIEHPSVKETVRALERLGFEVSWVAVGVEGTVDAGAIASLLREETVLVTLMLANNEVGTLQPVAEVARRCSERGILMHTDAVQAVGRIPVSVPSLGVDLLTLAAHKFHGPKGAGALFVRRGVSLHPLLTGGGQERRRRGGTENVAGIVGLGKACVLAGETMGAAGIRLAAWRDRLEIGLLAAVPGARVNGAGAPRVPNTSNISFPGLEGETLLIQLDLAGIAVSTGSACSSGSLKPSDTLLAMGIGQAAALGALRFSMHRMSRESDIERVLEVLPPAAERLRALTGARP